MARVTLHDEIERILAKNRGPMSARSIAAEIETAGRYLPPRASTISQQQIHARIGKHPDRFVSESGAIGLLADRMHPPSRARPLPIVQAYDDRERWDWEGNVQATLARHLTASGWTIESAANTATRERGIDLLLTKDGRRLAIEVKGYPGSVYARGPKAGQPKLTAPTNQARHWFAGALLSAVLTPEAGDQPAGATELALAFPDLPRYRGLIARSEWALRRLEIQVFLVSDDGGLHNAISF